MKYKTLGKTGFKISTISLGTWQVGGKWGDGFNDKLADEILNTAVDNGINFIDTADVYEAGKSEAAVGRLIKSRSEKIYIATKCGRQINPHTNTGYTPQVLRTYVEASLRNTGLECLDLIQLHCPPTEVYYRPEIFELFDRLKEEGKIASLGVSVEKVEEGLKAIEFDNVDTIQIIFNIFRQRPSELFFEESIKKNIGILARVPLASGLLTGKFSSASTFSEGDHRFFNRDGAGFDKGETFSGVNYDLGLATVSKIQAAIPELPITQLALKWIQMFDAVTCVIPGASKVEHVLSNLETYKLPNLHPTQMAKIKAIYEENIKKGVHHLW
jgi:aryl-alcohol dehydrogenase-like predicted oxidoreductase